jgi:hypothetical protein
MRSPWRRVAKFPLLLLLALAVLALLGAVVMYLWNALIPALFHGPTLLYGQAVALLVLCRLLFGGLRPRGWHRGHWRREHWQHMSPEERAQLRERMLDRCGRRGGEGGGSGAAPAA